MEVVEREEADSAIDPLSVYLRSAILSLEPPDCIITLARQLGAGSLSVEVQNFILEHCIQSFDTYLLKGNKRVIRRISFLFSNCSSKNHSKLNNFVTPIRCSLNMLEGDTGCAIWPSSLFLSEFIFSYSGIFRNKYCFELGSGVGLVGIALAKVDALKVDCKYLQWETADEVELESFQPEIILGADIIYNPICVPHLLHVLSILLVRKVPSVCDKRAKDCNGNGNGNGGSCRTNNSNLSCTETNHATESRKIPVAYIATVIRNADTFDYFLKLAGETNLYASDITESLELPKLLPYMLSYDRASVRLYKVSASPC